MEDKTKSHGGNLTKKSILRSKIAAVSAVAFLSVSLLGAAPASALDLKSTSLEVGEEVTFTAMGDVKSSPDGTVAIEELERIGVTTSDIESAIASTKARSLQGNPMTTSSAVAAAAMTGAYGILDQWKDNAAKTTVVRRGTTTWGYHHFTAKHQSTINMARKTTQFPKTKTITGNTIVYETPAHKYVCSMALGCRITHTMNVRAVVANQRQTDGLQKGIITVYCIGPTICPAWVVAVAN